MNETIEYPCPGDKPKQGEWVWVEQHHLDRMACDRRLKWTHWRVLAWILARATYAQDLTLRQQDMVSALGIHPKEMSRILRDLDSLGLVVLVPTFQKPRTYRLNRQYFGKGRRVRGDHPD